MDRRAYIAFFIAILLLLLLFRKRVVDTVTRFGGFALTDGGLEDREFTPIKLPAVPAWKPGPEMWTQTTGLMCHCEDGQYSGGTWNVREITIPRPPIPRYITRPKAPEQIASIPLTYVAKEFAGSSADVDARGTMAFGQAWWTRPPGWALVGSDGRVFALDEGPPSSFIINPSEYRLENSVIYYGPYEYHLPGPRALMGST